MSNPESHAAVLAEDLPAIYEVIARDNPAAADRVLDAVEATFEQLSAQPECGMTYPTRPPRLRGVRMPSTFFKTHAPRKTGEVVVPLAVTFRMLACVRRPPRGLSGGSGTLRNSSPLTASMP